MKHSLLLRIGDTPLFSRGVLPVSIQLKTFIVFFLLFIIGVYPLTNSFKRTVRKSYLESQEEAKQTFTINEVLEESIADWQKKFFTVRSFNLNIHENVARISGDKFLIREAIDNLIKNAVDLSSKNGEIDISLSCSNGSAVIQIKDHGTGIPGYAQERVFEKFYSLPRPSGGRKSSGLGLSIVRQITCLHNGTVKLANNQNSGAFAMLRFPVKTA